MTTKPGTGFEPCTFYSKTAEAPPGQGFLVAQSLWLIPKKENIPVEHPLYEVDRILVIPSAQMPNIVPKTNDLVTRDLDGTQWRCLMIENPMKKDWRIHLIHVPERTLGTK